MLTFVTVKDIYLGIYLGGIGKELCRSRAPNH